MGSCLNELLQLEHGEVMSRFKLRTCNALFNALDSVTDSVEISNDEHEIQVSVTGPLFQKFERGIRALLFQEFYCDFVKKN